MKLNPVHVAAMIISLTANPAPAHDWYSGLQTPSGVACCNDGDCQRVGHRYSAADGHEIQIDDHWVRVDPKIILPLSSPDGLTARLLLPLLVDRSAKQDLHQPALRDPWRNGLVRGSGA